MLCKEFDQGKAHLMKLTDELKSWDSMANFYNPELYGFDDLDRKYIDAIRTIGFKAYDKIAWEHGFCVKQCSYRKSERVRAAYDYAAKYSFW